MRVRGGCVNRSFGAVFVGICTRINRGINFPSARSVIVLTSAVNPAVLGNEIAKFLEGINGLCIRGECVGRCIKNGAVGNETY